MNLRVDRKADTLYLRLDDSLIVESEEVSPGVVLDYNESNEVVGVEMLHTTLSEGGTTMKLLYYPETDSLYVEFNARPGADTIEVTEGLNVDYRCRLAKWLALTSTRHPGAWICPRWRPRRSPFTASRQADPLLAKPPRCNWSHEQCVERLKSGRRLCPVASDLLSGAR